MLLLKRRKNVVRCKIFAPLEFLYNIGFSVAIFFKKRRGFFDAKPFKVISVGNLSVGCTGKSVFVLFLSKILGPGAILLRGYGRKNKKEKNILVHRGTQGIDVDSIGDEAMMFLYQGGVPVAVGADRRRSIKLLKKFCEQERRSFRYVFLDDAYQNFQLKKDFEILLLDARAPFGNGRCLPLGPLREKDASRANVIVLTHADMVAKEEIIALQKKYFPTRVFAGRHAVTGVFVPDSNENVDCSGKKIFAFAGIGSFSGFLESLQKNNLSIVGHKKFSDHALYSVADIEWCVKEAKRLGADAIVTTEKDWQKLRALVMGDLDAHKNYFYVLRVQFEFLSDTQQDEFVKMVESSVS
jgi:tetraacyldisaccharide 4'-kinase